MSEQRWGTGEEIARLPLGKVGDLVVMDDGCYDEDVNVYIEDETGAQRSPGHVVCHKLRDGVVDDEDIIRAFGQARTSPLPNGYEPSYHQGEFACNDCHRTFPGKYRGDDGEEVCPDCRGDG